VSKVEGNIVEALAKQAARPYSLKARANLRLRLGGKEHPRIKGIVSWARTPESISARITGITAFGITVFDCMVSGGAFYLFDPSQDTVYVAGLHEKVLDGWDLEALAQEAFWILAPWATYQSRDATILLYRNGLTGPDAKFCVVFPHGGTEGATTFDAATLAPGSLRLPELTVTYGDPIGLPDGSPYPTKFEVRFTDYPLDLEIALKDLETDSLSAADGVFDPSVFTGKPTRPLEVLLDRLRQAQPALQGS
jgi:hypothetical protein